MKRFPLSAFALIATLSACQGEVSEGPGAATTYGIGTPIAPAEIAALNTDVSPSGEGLPSGSGDAALGAVLYQAQCAGCHGANGEGASGSPPGPRLVGREPRDGFPFGSDAKLVRTIGNYWPEATTLYDYIKRTMPLATPGLLTDDEVYSLTAYLLAANEILPAGATLDSASLMAVRMPAKDRFVRDNRRGGAEVK
jgi:cytochrome c